MRPPNGQPRTKRNPENPHENIDPCWATRADPRHPNIHWGWKPTSWSRGSHQNRKKKKRRWWEPPGGKLLVPKGMALSLVSQVHRMTHLGHDKLKNLTQRYFLIPRLSSLCRKEFQNYNAWSQINPAPGYRPKPPGTQLKGTLPFEYLEVDFIEMKYYHHFHYLLVLLCTFLWWVEVFPTRTERTSEVTWSLLREIVPWFGFPTSIESDNSPAFILDLIQQVNKAMNIKWKLHTAYQPQNSEMVERTNRTLKETLSK